MLSIFRKKSKPDVAPTVDIDANAIPPHIAIVMDGNGRWASARGLPRTAGHREGAVVFRTIASHCADIGVKHLTVYAFSTENWKRPPEEVDAIMKLLREYLLEAQQELQTRNIQIRVLGDTSALDPDLQELIAKVTALNRVDGSLIANLAINYGGRAEMVHAANAAFAKTGRPISESELEEHLYTAGQPDPDLLIRPSGEVRLSGFLLWQCAYSELYFTDVLWPDFTPAHLDAAIAAYQRRDRRFGGI